MKGSTVKLANEPVATASATTIIAGGLVTIGQVTHLYKLDADQAAVLVGGVFAIVSALTSFLARRKVTPVAKAAAQSPVTIPGA